MPTYYAQITYTGNGSTTSFAIPFPFLDGSHVKAYINGTLNTNFTISTSTLVFATAPANGATVRIERQTPIDVRLVDFQDGSVLTEADLDKSANQTFYIAQEVSDDSFNNMAVDTDDKYNANSKVIKNVANPVNANDVVNKTYLENTWLSTADKATLTNLNSNIASVTAVNSALTNVNAVGSDLLEAVSEINTVAVSIANVDTVGTNITNVNTVAGNNANINTVASANSNITTVAGANANITAVAGQITPTNNISTVAGAVANIGTVATNVANVNIVGGAIANVNTVAGANANITTVATANTNIGTVATNVANVNLVGGSIANVNTVATNVANVNTVATNNANITTVAGANANITTLAGISGAISTVASNSANISTIATDIARVITTANDLNEAISEIDTVANAITNVDLVGNSISNVNTVATNIANINAVNSNSSNINAVNSNSTNINTVATNNANITTVATNIANINSVNSNSSNINSVAGNSSNINAVVSNATNINSVATNSANINTVASNVASVNSFANVYRIASTAPSTSLDTGDLWFDTTAGKLKIWNGTSFDLAGSSINGTSARFIYTATSGQTTFTGTDGNGNTLAYDSGYIDVYLNGIRLNPADYTATNGSSVVLASGATTGDILYIVGFGTFSLANLSANDITSGTLNTSRGGTGLTTLGTAGQVLKVNSGATALEYGTVDLANLSATSLTSGTLPDARFPATLPATSGANLTSLNASNLSSGTVSTARLGSGTADATTYLRGDNSWQTISSSPTQLVSSVPLASGVSVTAGKLVSINSSGEIPAYPTLNTYGTAQTNSSTTAYSWYSLDGSRVLKLVLTGTYTFTWSGTSISNTATPVNGTVNVTSTFGSEPTYYLNYVVYPISNTQFIVNQVRWLYQGNCCNYSRMEAKTFIVTVDASGNCTKGTENGTGGTGNTGGGGGVTSYGFGKISNNIFAFNYVANNGTTNSIFTISGTTITATSDADAQYFKSCGNYDSQITTSNIIGWGTGANWRTATYTSSPVTIGTYTDTTALSDYLSGATWYMMKNSATANAEYALVTYTDTSGVAKYKTFSINQTTGALTLVETGNFSALVGWSGSITFKDKNNLVAGGNTATSYSFTNGVLNGYNSQGYTPVGVTIYNSADLYFIFYLNASSYPVNIGYTVNAYATAGVNYLGVVKTTTSISPASIVTDGVATGFTSLTNSSLYYLKAPFDGTVTTSSASGILIGKAKSSTEILMQRSNTQ
jgi:hypothetical protein